jgi:uroporphyrinogen-III decarboxylase
MTSKERILASLQGKPVDHIPFSQYSHADSIEEHG